MAFDVRFTPTAAAHLRGYKKFQQQMMLDAVAERLTHEPTTETRNRKRLGENPLSDWVMRVANFRLFYDVVSEEDRQVVKIKAIGHKDHNRLYVGGEEIGL